MTPLLSVRNVNVSFRTQFGEVKAVRDVGFEVTERETLAIVGESGCGKSALAKSILNLHIHGNGIVQEGSEVLYRGENLLKMGKKELNRIRGRKIGMIFQDSMTALNPTSTIGDQIAEPLIIHGVARKNEVKMRVEELLRSVRIADPRERMGSYPHQLSGGMRQRAMIAVSIACSPELLIADEPTTALDVTVQAQILDLLCALKDRTGMAIILITHDMGVVAGFADSVLVMYAGGILERGSKDEIFGGPRHPYTWALLNAIPGKAMARKSRLYSIKGDPPNLLLPIDGCAFAARCAFCMPVCKRCRPKTTKITETHSVRCWLTHELAPKVRRGVNAHAQ
ncbi:MAG: ABC transporter ATP-binding protein [Clostridiales Family XIII bacterium]|jgi:oligopeptide transport system ATP-binding protein|nr:ABC transporter ATP-binding protein [Clostridiales Family XIII bacterium]